MGANERVGLEDRLYIGRGELVVSHAQQVKRIRRILEELGIEIAQAGEARTVLALKGAGVVGL
jgi:3,5-dioxohexanoate:acetyl-CoA acetone transferase